MLLYFLAKNYSEENPKRVQRYNLKLDLPESLYIEDFKRSIRVAQASIPAHNTLRYL